MATRSRANRSSTSPALAGAWLVAVAGFGGLRDHGDTLSFGPSLPSAVSRLSFGLLYRDRRLRVEITPGHARYELVAGQSIEILHQGEAIALDPDAPVVVPWHTPTPPEGDVGPPPGRAPAQGS